jgi:hypothetical protein
MGIAANPTPAPALSRPVSVGHHGGVMKRFFGYWFSYAGSGPA